MEAKAKASGVNSGLRLHTRPLRCLTPGHLAASYEIFMHAALYVRFLVLRCNDNLFDF